MLEQIGRERVLVEDVGPVSPNPQADRIARDVVAFDSP